MPKPAVLQALVPEAEWAARSIHHSDLTANQTGMGRELFAMFRQHVQHGRGGRRYQFRACRRCWSLRSLHLVTA